MLRVDEIFGGACYHNKKTRNWVTATLMSKSINMLFRAETIINSKKLLNVFECKVDIIQLHSKLEKIFKKIKNPFLDIVSISTALENYFKAKLLMNNFVIHEIIPNEENKLLYKEQRKKPILISRLKLTEGLSNKRKNNYCFSLLHYKTLNFHTILNQSEYNKFYDLTQTDISTINRIKKFRNSLHFIMDTNSVWNKSIVSDYICIFNYAKSHMIGDYNKLAKRQKLFPQCIIDENKMSIKFMKNA